MYIYSIISSFTFGCIGLMIFKKFFKNQYLKCSHHKNNILYYKYKLLLQHMDTDYESESDDEYNDDINYNQSESDDEYNDDINYNQSESESESESDDEYNDDKLNSRKLDNMRSRIITDMVTKLVTDMIADITSDIASKQSDTSSIQEYEDDFENDSDDLLESYDKLVDYSSLDTHNIINYTHVDEYTNMSYIEVLNNTLLQQIKDLQNYNKYGMIVLKINAINNKKKNIIINNYLIR
jgi:hypothetical protein